MAEGYDNIYGKLYSKANVYSGEFTTSSLAAPSDNAIIIDLPQGITYDKLLGVTFLGCQPNATWNATLMLFKYVKQSDTAIQVSGHVSGSGTQTYTIRYLLLYKD